MNGAPLPNGLRRRERGSECKPPTNLQFNGFIMQQQQQQQQRSVKVVTLGHRQQQSKDTRQMLNPLNVRGETPERIEGDPSLKRN